MNLCGSCLRLTTSKLTNGNCPTCAPATTRRPQTQASGWHRYPEEYRTNRDTLLAPGPPCFWQCGRPADTADHLIPRSLGGNHTLANLVPACGRCNTARRNRDANTFATSRGLDLNALLATERARREGRVESLEEQCC